MRDRERKVAAVLARHERSRLVRYSQQVRDETALEARRCCRSRLRSYGGDFVAIGVMDGGVFEFKDNTIYVI